MIATCHYRRIWGAAALLLICGACSKDSGLQSRNSVWDTYDFRHPVPYGAPVPDSRATVYDQYQEDYESYYTPPKGYYAPPARQQRDYEQDYTPPKGYSPYSSGTPDYEEYYTPPRSSFQKNYNPCIPGDPGCIAGR